MRFQVTHRLAGICHRRYVLPVIISKPYPLLLPGPTPFHCPWSISISFFIALDVSPESGEIRPSDLYQTGFRWGPELDVSNVIWLGYVKRSSLIQFGVSPRREVVPLGSLFPS